MNIQLLELPILLLSVAANLSIGLLVLYRNSDSWTNRLFALLNVAWIGWTVATYFSLHNVEFRLELVRFSMFFVVLMNTVFFFFVRIFPKGKHSLKGRHKLLAWYSLLVGAAALSPFLFSSVELDASGAISPQPGPAIVLFVLHAVVSITGSLMIIISRLWASKGILRDQLSFILAGTILFFTIVPLTNFIFPIVFQKSEFVIFSPLAPIVFAIFIGYTIVRHRLFDIRLIVARSVAYILLLGSLSALYAVVLFSISSLFLDGSAYNATEQTINIIAAIILAFTFQPLKRFFDRITNRIFYRDAYNSEVVIRQVNEVVLSSLALEGLLFGVVQTLVDELRVQFGVAGVKQVNNVNQTVVATNDVVFDQSDIERVRQTTSQLDKRVVLTDELEDTELQSTLREYNIDILARIVADPTDGEEGLGYVMLGPKRSGSLYTSKDIELLNLIAGEMVVAVQNALRFEEISQFNQQLTQRVGDATAELKDKNRKLRELDEAKDDFISMASHQLRTPLTTVKGYLSMLDDGDLGKLGKKQQEVVELAFASSERMVYLISDLLNASRIDTGKFVIERQPLKLGEIIKSEVEQLSITAEARDLELVSKFSDDDPTVKLDETKLRQVIMNFIDNAIYYSKPGGKIIVRYEATHDAIELRVVDEGIGVPDADKDGLFTKFYRAKNAKRVRPDGTGLGLFLAKKVITAQGGSVIFESEEGKGSTFGFRFALASVATTGRPVSKK